MGSPDVVEKHQRPARAAVAEDFSRARRYDGRLESRLQWRLSGDPRHSKSSGIPCSRKAKGSSTKMQGIRSRIHQGCSLPPAVRPGVKVKGKGSGHCLLAVRMASRRSLEYAREIRVVGEWTKVSTGKLMNQGCYLSQFTPRPSALGASTPH